MKEIVLIKHAIGKIKYFTHDYEEALKIFKENYNYIKTRKKKIRVIIYQFYIVWQLHIMQWENMILLMLMRQWAGQNVFFIIRNIISKYMILVVIL